MTWWETFRAWAEDPRDEVILDFLGAPVPEKVQRLLEAEAKAFDSVYARQRVVGEALLGRKVIVEIDTTKVRLRAEDVVLRHSHAGAVGLVLNFGEDE